MGVDAGADEEGRAGKERPPKVLKRERSRLNFKFCFS